MILIDWKIVRNLFDHTVPETINRMATGDNGTAQAEVACNLQDVIGGANIGTERRTVVSEIGTSIGSKVHDRVGINHSLIERTWFRELHDPCGDRTVWIRAEI
jgi:hypothetical protein